ncbi:AAA family ATPase [Micromonospora sp. NBC_01796]|uniref:AAA family ATPase n=1 Tax=Micromonospora sp. NBC_01796 TaxID=2975987 RepID=UPI002DDC36B1|nr:AAA family ATPase [Micromonospora sp. NBC_01796]WSA88088.1 helicase RepA family protein [Micromonospora sp. NBC_01796]
MTDDDLAFEEIEDVMSDKLGRVLTLADIHALPPPEPLIEGALGFRSAVIMVGATGSNKTFAVIGMGCSVATGKPWLGHHVAMTGHVIFVVGEGAYGLGGRIAAWEEENEAKLNPEMVTFVLKPASLKDPIFWEALTKLAVDRDAVLVVLDTFSSLAPEADETKDAAPVMRYLSDLSMDIDGTAVLVHHTGWGPQNRARGGSQFESNADEVIVLEKQEPDNPETLVCIRRKKVKEGPAGAETWVRRVPVGRSAVLEVADVPASEKGPRPAMRKEILTLVTAEPWQHTKTDVRARVGGKPTIFNEVWNQLTGMPTPSIVARSVKRDGDRQESERWGPPRREE